MGMMINRRRAYGGKEDENKGFTLLYHWESEDGLKNNAWVDRVQGVRIEEKRGNPQYVNGLFYVNDANTFRMNMNAAAPQGLSFGSEWKVEIEILLDSLPQDNKSFVVDFGSVYSSMHAFSFFINNQGNFSQNAKLVNNNSAPLYSATIPNAYEIGKVFKLTYGVEAYNRSNNIPYATYKKTKVFASTTITPARSKFDRNFSTSTLVVGGGVIGGNASQTFFYVKSIKIYHDDRERPTI